ncbi:MAG: hypothetical protein QXN77_08155 [Candidatus Caldarchaeum sp.]
MRIEKLVDKAAVGDADEVRKKLGPHVHGVVINLSTWDVEVYFDDEKISIEALKNILSQIKQNIGEVKI